MQWNGYQQWQHPWFWTLTTSRSSPWCPCQRTPSLPSSFGSCPQFCCEALLWPVTQRRPSQNSPKGWSQVSWEAWPSSQTPPGGSSWASPASSSLPVSVWNQWISLHFIRFVSQILRHPFLKVVLKMFSFCPRVLLTMLFLTSSRLIISFMLHPARSP